MERQSYSNFIKNKYGENIYRDIICYQISTKEIEVLNEDINFLSKCKKSGIIPVHCRIGKRRSASPNTKRIIISTEKKFLNRSISKNYSKRWKHQQMKRQRELSIEEELSLADYMRMIELTSKKQQNTIAFKRQHLSKKSEKLLKKKIGSGNSITSEDRREHQSKTLLNFTDIEIPKEFYPLLSKGLDFKVAGKKLPLIDIICSIEETIKSFCSPGLANEFRFECKRILKRGRTKRNVNISEEICSGLKIWLRQNELILIENDKGRATCIISKIKRD